MKHHDEDVVIIGRGVIEAGQFIFPQKTRDEEGCRTLKW